MGNTEYATARADSAPSDYRTLWISDLHLGSPGAQAEALLCFLRQTQAQHIYLVGDILDLWALRRRPQWPAAHMEVARHLLAQATDGVEVTYIPGNHDHALRAYAGQCFGPIRIVERAVHLTADGRRLLIMHGDEFDPVMCHAPWLAHVGDVLYDWLHALNKGPSGRAANAPTPKVGVQQPATVSARAKDITKRVIQVLGRFEHRIEQACVAVEADGIVCGHSHHAALRPMRGILYCNDGDWVESHTALVEHHDGQLELLHRPAFAPSTSLPVDDTIALGSSP